MVVEAIDGGQCEVSVEGVSLKALHDGEHRHAVPPNVPRDVEHLATANPPSVKVDRGRRCKVVQVGVRRLSRGNLAHMEGLFVGDQTKWFPRSFAFPTTECVRLKVVHLHREVPGHRDLLVNSLSNMVRLS